MKRLLLAMSLCATLMTGPAPAQNLSCGLMPIPPVGCSRSNAQCVCDASGRCQWVFTGCR
jgi:hypothetical protein